MGQDIDSAGGGPWIWGLFILWAPVFLLSQLWSGTSAGTALAGAQALILIGIVLLQGRLVHGWQGFGAYVAIAALISFLLEACSIATGFPFGFYTHLVEGMPKPLGVPPTVVAGYVLLGWLAWSVARVIVRDDPNEGGGLARITTPLVAAFVLAGYDYPLDPIGSTILHMWAYRDPSGTFGVPLTNYLGWIFTGWVFFQMFALVEHRFPARQRPGAAAWIVPPLIWLLFAAQYPLTFLHAPEGVARAGDRSFLIADIHEAAISASLFSLVLPALIALARLAGRARAPKWTSAGIH